MFDPGFGGDSCRPPFFFFLQKLKRTNTNTHTHTHTPKQQMHRSAQKEGTDDMHVVCDIPLSSSNVANDIFKKRTLFSKVGNVTSERLSP